VPGLQLHLLSAVSAWRGRHAAALSRVRAGIPDAQRAVVGGGGNSCARVSVAAALSRVVAGARRARGRESVARHRPRMADEFLATETLFFGVLFFAYAMGRWHFGDAFPIASRHTNVVLGTVNTAVLLTSSLAMALSVRAAQLGRRHATQLLLALTMLLGVAFL